MLFSFNIIIHRGFNTLFFQNNDKGESETIGIILIVAIVVILAALVAAYSLGLLNNIGKNNIPVFTITKMSNDVLDITFADKNGAQIVSELTIISPETGSLYELQYQNGGLGNPCNIGTVMSVGDVYRYKYVNVPMNDIHLVVTAKVDGKEKVVIDTNV
ncbi:hypothetical protein CUJ83_06960 [Methanocella sp. CWC-04]|uniref:Archaeal Type IV pilin N-terminal domain-containing protein n=1 Tax=Methanooceanicella nereidis TaxID=2052831 RepID=A0AAP2REK3_9EURY|nr:hypothetical protein [Methanocella sp. CWC-04]